MAISLSFFLAVTKARIESDNLQTHPVSIRCQLRYTLSSMSWGADRRTGGEIVRHTFGTADKCPPKFWANGQCKGAYHNAAPINRRLAEMRERAERLHEQFVREGRFPAPEQFAAQIVQENHNVLTEKSFWARYAQYLEFLENRGVTQTFVTSQRRVMTLLKKFERDTQTALDFDSIGRTFAAKFTRWMTSQKMPYQRAGQDVEKTATYKIRDLKHFLNHAVSEGWSTSLIHRQIQISIRRAEPFPTTLTADELNRLNAITKKDLADKHPGKRADRLLISRDWFLFATQMGMRYGNWNIDDSDTLDVKGGGKNLRFQQVKTKNPLEIPLSTIALEVLERNGGNIPARFSPTATINHLNALCQVAGIAKRITTHTARRTFCTLQEQAGVPRSVIMRISGHKTEREYIKYLGVSFERNAENLRLHNPEMFAAKAAG